jgi:hypothetical protein
MSRKIKISAVLIMVFLCAGAFGENIFELRLNPALALPAGVENFKTGFGADAALDWSYKFPKQRTPLWGISADFEYSNLSIADGSGFVMLGGELGPFFQWRLLDRLTLRGSLNAGLYNFSWGAVSSTKFQAGLGASVFFHFYPAISFFANTDYSYHVFSESRALNMIRMGLGISINLSEFLRPEVRVQGEKTEQRRVFPVSYAWYERNPAASVRITNNEPNTITNINLSFFMERYMNQPAPFATIDQLLPGESAELPLTALFNESMLDLTENIDANGLVSINYRSLGARKQTGFSLLMPIFHRNALSWDDDRRAASFVSARDPAALYFAKYSAQTVRGRLKPNLPVNVQNALALFETLRLYGITYVIDPASSYIELSDNASALDSLNYPYETLYYRAGDCDDLSILYCAMLEVLGIETAFITIPGHIYMAFNPADEEWSKRNTDNLIEANGKFWFPIEITIPGEGFMQAWRTGVREWNNAEANRSIFPMADSWTLYPPVSVPGAGERLPAMPEPSAIERAFDSESGRLGR